MTSSNRHPLDDDHAEAEALGVAESPSSEPPIRIGILHLMIWTAGSAALLALFQVYGRNQLPAEYQTLFVVFHACNALVYGAAVGSLAVMVQRWIQGWRFPISAGHWVLVLFGMGTIFMGLNALLFFALRAFKNPSQIDDPLYRLAFSFNALLDIVTALAFASLLLLRIPIRWKTVAVLLAMSNICQAGIMAMIALNSFQIMGLFDGLTSLISLLQLIPLGICLIMDLRDDQKYDALHWGGLAVVGASIALHFFWKVGSFFVSSSINVSSTL